MPKGQITATIEEELIEWIEKKVQDRTFRSKSEAVELSITIIQYIHSDTIRNMLIEDDCKTRQVFLFLDKTTIELINNAIEKRGLKTKEDLILHLIKENL